VGRLTGQPGAAAADLAVAGGIGRSTATRTLAAWEQAGRAIRAPGGREGTQRLPDRWRAVEVGRAATEEPGLHQAAPQAALDDGGAAAGRAAAAEKVRLGAGKLLEMVLAHLRQHPGEEFTASTLGRALSRSSGAIANACEKLAASQEIVQTSGTCQPY
jgi:hypothetical protein